MFNTKSFRKKILIHFIVSLIVLLILDLIFSYSVYRVSNSSDKFRRESKLRHELESSEILIKNKFKTIISDLLYIAHTDNLKKYNGSKNKLENLENDFYSFSRAKELYSQVRYLDLTGKEIIRINYKNEKIETVAHSKLQNKKDRYYYTETMKLKNGDIYMSPLDLNIENGHIEEPYTPMIRFGTPVYDIQNKKKGVIIFNYLGNDFFKEVELYKEKNALTKYEIIVLNNESYYLKSNNIENQWGFMFKNKKNVNFSNQNPNEWNLLKFRSKKSFYSSKGYYDFFTFHPLREALDEGKKIMNNLESNLLKQKEYYWKIIFYITDDFIKKDRQKNIKKILNFNILIFPIIFMVSAIIAYYSANNFFYKKELEFNANYDTLTGIYNRRFGIEILKKYMALSVRKSSSLTIVYIDINNLKYVNDNFGHSEGDFYIKTVILSITETVRSSDILFRLGGDEFMLVLDDCNKKKTEKLIDIIKNKLLKIENSKEYSSSASFGIISYDKDIHINETYLIAEADKLMYLDKMKYKSKK